MGILIDIFNLIIIVNIIVIYRNTNCFLSPYDESDSRSFDNYLNWATYTFNAPLGYYHYHHHDRHHYYYYYVVLSFLLIFLLSLRILYFSCINNKLNRSTTESLIVFHIPQINEVFPKLMHY